MTTTFRRDTRSALVTILEAQSTATPTLLRKVEATRPGSFAEVPCAYISNLTEDVSWTAGVRTRLMSGAEITIVDSYREAAHDGLDQLVDLLLDRFNDAVQQIPNAILEVTRVADVEVAVESSTGNTLYYRGVAITLGKAAKWEGRN